MTRRIEKEDLLKLSRGNTFAFYHNLRQAIAQVERAPVNRLSDDQVLNLALEHAQRGSIDLNLDGLDGEFVVPNTSISESSYIRRARARGAALNEDIDQYPQTTETQRLPISEEQSRWIAFNVSDEESGEPLSNVILKVQMPDGNIRKLYTDASGEVRIEGLDYGPFHVLEIQHHDVSLISSFGS